MLSQNYNSQKNIQTQVKFELSKFAFSCFCDFENFCFKKRTKTLGNGYVSHVYHLLVFLFPHPLAPLENEKRSTQKCFYESSPAGIRTPADWPCHPSEAGVVHRKLILLSTAPRRFHMVDRDQLGTPSHQQPGRIHRCCTICLGNNYKEQAKFGQVGSSNVCISCVCVSYEGVGLW